MLRRGLMYTYISILNLLLIGLWIDAMKINHNHLNGGQTFFLSAVTVLDVVGTWVVLRLISDDRKRDQLEQQ